MNEITNSFKQVVSRLIEAQHDDIADQLYKEIRDLNDQIADVLAKQATMSYRRLGHLFLILTSLLIEAGQYRHETAGLHVDLCREVREGLLRTLRLWLQRPELEPIRPLLMNNVLPLLQRAVSTYFPYRVNLVCAAVDRLYEIGAFVMDDGLEELIDYIVERKYPRFGTSGIRGVWGKDFTRRRIMFVVHAICDLAEKTGLSDKPFVIGYDSREHADEVAMWAAGVCLARGHEVLFSTRDSPTPALVYYGRKVLKSDIAGLLVATASHNPAEWQGIKYYPPSCFPAPTNVTNWIGSWANLLQLTHDGEPEFIDLSMAKEKVAYFDPLDDYCSWILEKLRKDIIRTRLKKKLIVVDEMHGAGRGYIRRVLDALGCRYVVVHGWKDPRFGNLLYANPEDPFLTECKEVVRQTGAILGVALDADADRFGIVDEYGRFLTPHQVLMMLIDYLVNERGWRGKIIRSFTTTRVIDDIVIGLPGVFRPTVEEPIYIRHTFYKRKHGEHYLRRSPCFSTMVGIKYLAEAMRLNERYQVDDRIDPETSFVIAGEESGGLTTFGHLPDKDGIWADLLVIEMVAHRGKPPSEIWEEVREKYKIAADFGRVDIDMPEEVKLSLINTVLSSPLKEIDGLSLSYAGGIFNDFVELFFEGDNGRFARIVVRASGTEPVCRIYTDASDRRLRRGLEGYVLELLRKLLLEEIGRAGDLLSLAYIMSTSLPSTELLESVKSRLRQLSPGDLRPALYNILELLRDDLESRRRLIADMWLSTFEPELRDALGSLPELDRAFMVFDVDGTIYPGVELLAPALRELASRRVGLCLMTTMSKEQILSRVLPALRRLEVPLDGVILYCDGALRKFTINNTSRLEGGKRLSEDLILSDDEIRYVKELVDAEARARGVSAEVEVAGRTALFISVPMGMSAHMASALRERLREKGMKVLEAAAPRTRIIVQKGGKALALRDLLSHLGLDERQVIYLGDEFYPRGADMEIADTGVSVVAVNPLDRIGGLPENAIYAGPGAHGTRFVLEWLLSRG